MKNGCHTRVRERIVVKVVALSKQAQYLEFFFFFFWVELGSTFFLLKLKLMKIMLIKLSTKYMCFLGFETLFEFVNLTYFGNFLITIYFGNLRLNFDEN